MCPLAQYGLFSYLLGLFQILHRENLEKPQNIPKECFPDNTGGIFIVHLCLTHLSCCKLSLYSKRNMYKDKLHNAVKCVRWEKVKCVSHTKGFCIVISYVIIKPPLRFPTTRLIWKTVYTEQKDVIHADIQRQIRRNRNLTCCGQRQSDRESRDRGKYA